MDTTGSNENKRGGYWKCGEAGKKKEKSVHKPLHSLQKTTFI